MEPKATPNDPFPKPPPLPEAPAAADASLTGKRTVHTSLSLRPTGGQRMVPTQPAAEGDASVRVQSAPVAATLPASVARAQAQAGTGHGQPLVRIAPTPGKEPAHQSAAPKPVPATKPAPVRESGGLSGPKAFFAWLLHYGPFANHMARRDAMPPLFPLVLALAGLGLLWPLLSWIVPADPGPVPMLDAGFWTSTVLKAVFLGPGVYFLFGLLAHFLLTMAGGRQDFSAAAQIALYAWLPYSLCQIAAVAFFANQYGEAYWRGYVPPGIREYSMYASVILLSWVGWRVAAAAHCYQGLPRIRAAMLMLVLPLSVLAAPPIQRFYHGYNQKRTSEQLMERALGGYLGRETKRTIPIMGQVMDELGAADGEQRASLWLMRGELLLLQGLVTEARADFLRVAHRYPPGHALHATANAANFIALGHKDFALSSLRTALSLDPDEPFARAWMTRYAAGDFQAEWSDLPLAEENAREWVRLDATTLSLRYLIDALYRQNKYEEALEVALSLLNRNGHAISYYQGGMSAYRLGSQGAARQFFDEAIKKDGAYASDPVVAKVTGEWSWGDNR